MNDIDVAVEAAHAAGAILKRHEDGPTQIHHKGAIDLVTEIDLSCEQAIRDVLTARTPDIPILGEEQGGDTEAPTTWIVDPLDGTTNYVHGFPHYGVSIALRRDNRLVHGVVYDPVRDKTYRASLGEGAWCNDRRMSVSHCPDLNSALVGTGFAYDRRERSAFYLRYFEPVLQRVQGIRRAGSAAMDLAMVADGRLDAYWEFGLQPWDVAAGIVLVGEAGGQVTRHDGTHIARDLGSPLATNGLLHASMQALLNR